MRFVVPSIDILAGKAVRLRQGRRETAEVLGEPLELAAKYGRAGFGWLHVVDLDAAFGGRSQLALLEKLAKAAGGMKMQVGGGIRSFQLAEKALGAGAARVVFGTALFTAPDEAAKAVAKFGPEKVWAALDFSGRPPVAKIRGWTAGAEVGIDRAVENAKKCGVGGVVASSIDADGMMRGPDLQLAASAAQRWGGPVWLAGGMRDAADAKAAFKAGAQGVVFGRALYGNIDLEELLCLQEG